MTSVRGRSQLSTFMYSYRAYGGGGGHDASVLFLNVDILLMLPPGGYDRENASPRDGLLRNWCYLQDAILGTR